MTRPNWLGGSKEKYHEFTLRFSGVLCLLVGNYLDIIQGKDFLGSHDRRKQSEISPSSVLASGGL